MLRLTRVLTSALFAACVAGSLLGQRIAVTNTWVDSPEAIFLTGEERAEWWMLESDAERAAFQDRYWEERNPTPNTPRNQFKEVVLSRIATADQRFRVEQTRGSETARGFVFILLGTPAHAEDLHTAPLGPGQPPGIGSREGNEIAVTWTYDKLRTPKILDILGRPSLEVTFVIEPSRRRDQLQNPGLINSIRDTLAARSILRTIPLTSIRKADTAVDALPGPSLPQDLAAQLAEIADMPSARPLHGAAIWADDGSPLTLLWFVAPEPAAGKPPVLSGRIRDREQRQVASVMRPARPSPGFTLHDRGVVLSARLPLPGGSYDCAFVAQQAGITNPLAVSSGKVVVPQPDTAFAVSSLLLTDSMAPRPAESAAVLLGSVPLRPRADAVFSTNESLWYAFEVRNPSDPASVKLTVTLRRRGGDASVKTIQLPAALQKAGENLWVGGYEMPLTSIAPGDYSLYVTVTDGSKNEEVRRADFSVGGVPIR